MNAVVELKPRTDADMIAVLGSSLYPGAKPESVALVLGYCKASGYDPMKKPVHIVPMSVQVAPGKWEMRDTIMPGIAQYRMDAARTGEYGGKSEPEYGPNVTKKLGSAQITFPEWCKITVIRNVNGRDRAFTAKEYWMENYATAGRGKQEPNAMWSKRPYGQLAKCTESQALRMAFPEQTGGTNTGEEMEGKTFADAGPYIEVDAKPAAAQAATKVAPPAIEHDIPNVDESIQQKPRDLSDADKEYLAKVESKLRMCATVDQVHDIASRQSVRASLENPADIIKAPLEAMIKRALDHVTALAENPIPDDEIPF
jgi:phage recombination protein Bet